MKRKIRALALFLGIFPAASTLPVTMAQAQNLPTDVAESLSWMPPQSETLAVARGPVAFFKKGDKRFQNWRDWPVATPHFSVSNLQLSVIAPNLSGRVIESSLEARSKFRPPAGFGLMPYDGCGVVRLRPLAGESRDSLRIKLARGARKTVLIAGLKASVFEEKRENDLWRVYVVVPRDNIVLLSTERGFLETVLARMAKPTPRNRAFPASWSGWKLVDTAAPFWAVRRLDLPQTRSILNDDDAKATALVIYQNGAPQKPGLVFKYQSSNLKYGRALLDAMRGEIRSGLQLQVIAPDVTQITAPGGTPPVIDFYVLGFLGTGVYL